MFKKVRNFFYITWVQHLIRVGLATLIAIGICQLDLSYLDAWAYDLRVRTTPNTQPSGHIALIEITPTDVEFLQGEPKADHYSRLLIELKKSKPKAVLFLTDMHNLEGRKNELFKLSQETKNFKKLFFTIRQLIIKGQEDEIKAPAPLNHIPVVMNLITSDDTNFSKDNVTRRVILSNSGTEFIHPQLARLFNKKVKDDKYKGQFDFLTSKQAYIDFRPSGTYAPSSFLTVMQGAFDAEKFKNKIVIIGRNTVAESTDYKRTPLSRKLTAMTNLEVHANALDTLILDSSSTLAPKWVNYFVTIIISILALFSVFTLRPSRGLLVLLSALAAILGSSYILFALFGLAIGVTQPIFAIFICYYFFIPYRLVMENRKSWEYLQHNKILSEVEELKTNFLRMMSHDLKTPLARIQGMTEVAMRDPSPLSDLQKQALDNIKSSSTELTSFIESILNLTRIESNKVDLQVQSKDINNILKTVSSKCQFLAKEKNIKIITELEPLFSVKVDEGLLSQVFTNLIENAIKYSPNDTKILVNTEEVDGRIVIQIADQGYGIKSEDQMNVFDKFYRSESGDTVDIKGSGLGLYLSRYFVNLHKGNIVVESELNQGSTFTVDLPMNV